MKTSTRLVNFNEHRKTSHDAKDDVYIGRNSKWGNPFVIGRDGNRDEVIDKYETWIRQQPDLIASLPELEGKTLVCWCAPLPCHGDILLKLLQEKENQEGND